jgi:DNA-3-methyladenine glycosylase I
LLWKKRVLHGFQAWLSGSAIVNKRAVFQAAFDGLDPEKVARYGEADRARLMADAGIVRSNAKIDMAINGARLWLDMRERGEDFSTFLWDFVDGAPVQNSWRSFREAPVKTPQAEAMAKALKQKGFKFTGPVIVYAFMQAVGMVNDHETSCFRHEECRHLAHGQKA